MDVEGGVGLGFSGGGGLGFLGGGGPIGGFICVEECEVVSIDTFSRVSESPEVLESGGGGGGPMAVVIVPEEIDAEAIYRYPPPNLLGRVSEICTYWAGLH